MGQQAAGVGDREHQLRAASACEALRVLEGKRKIVIIVQLFAARTPLRFSELERRVEGVNQKMLVQQLKELEKDGIVVRTVYPQVPPKVEYSLSEVGRALGPAIEALVDWTMLKCKMMSQSVERG
ncbi:MULTISPECIES: winged helix-turn-helix transcriptional regulator [unclassified Corallococcus]|uniref:winged helix-turn-helix transcriptional regulator n=1 Tax=unclassified Corallococcus TaxID=2685029 RepID=UPI001A8DB22A|nr:MULTISPECIES: helix-turn-helix domain-containing protein [unclassified Corallococcus]MBN9687377.1 helix-turn-helix transcriptional regulator [Corallococcus sp. NCSPR001]WAS88801.1 helix-turn-helix domain-containing protein [Corallococcus sp. NCRR]